MVISHPSFPKKAINFEHLFIPPFSNVLVFFTLAPADPSKITELHLPVEEG